MTLATRERIYARRSVAIDRYMRSTLPVFWSKLQKDGSQFLSDDGSGTLMTVTGASWRINGRGFDGVDDYIDVSPAVADGKLGNAWTLICWGKLGKWNANQHYVGAGDKVLGSSYSGLDFNNSDQKLYARASQVTTNSVPSLNTYTNDSAWHFLVMTVSAIAAITSFWIDNVDQGSSGGPNPDLSPHIYMYIGQLAYNAVNTNPLQGTVGEVLLYSRELGIGEIKQIYLATRWRYQ